MKFRRKKSDATSRRSVSIDGAKAPVVRYYRPSDVHNSEKKQERAGDRVKTENPRTVNQSQVATFWEKTLRWGGLLLIVFLFFANLTLADTAVGVTSDNKGSFRPIQEYSTGAEEIFSSTMLNRVKLTVNSGEIEQAMKQKFPEIAHATVVVPLAGRELRVLLELSEPFARLLLAGNKQAVLSKEGIVLQSDEAQKAAQASFSDLIQVSMPAVNAEAGEQIVTSEELHLMSLLRSEFDGSTPDRPMLSSIEFNVQKREMRARFKGVTYYAKLTPEREVREQVGSLVATIKDMGRQGRKIAEYVDVRVEDRVFVK